MKKILHIINDEKFIVQADKLFNKAVPVSHNYLLIGKRKKMKHVEGLPINFMPHWKLLLPYLSKDISHYDVFIIHFLGGSKFKLLEKLPDKKPIIWIGWGSDYYSFLHNNKQNFLLEKTQKTYKSLEKNVFENFFHQKLKNLFLIRSSDKKIHLLKKINYFNTVISEDYDSMKLFFGELLPPFIDWNYPVFDEEIEHFIDNSKLEKKNLLLGNSYQASNNHLDAIDLLSKHPHINFECIYCPLSYGSSKVYRDKVIKYGQSKFGNKFKPIVKYLPYKDYVEILNSCQYFYLPTLRQQALGNLLVMLYAGACIILNKKNPTYSFLINRSVKIFSTDDLMNKCELNSEEKKSNKEFVKQNYSFEILLIKTKLFFNKILNQES